MEKYRQFGDGGTGVNPFVPLWSHHKSPLPMRVVKALLMTPIAVTRAALLAVSLMMMALTELLCAVLVVGIVRYPVYRFLSAFACRAMLLALGVIPNGDSLADHRRLKIAPPKTSGSSVFNSSHGTLVFCNQQSLADVIYLCLRLCPTFVFVDADGAPVRLGLLGALRRSVLGPGSVSSGPTPMSLEEIASAAQSGWGGPVVVFPEGANTNGSAVLSWKAKTFDGTTSLEKPIGAALCSLEYSKAGAYTPHHTVFSGWRHVFWQSFQPWHCVRAVWLPAAEAGTAIKGKPVKEQWPLLRTVLTRMIQGAVEVDVPAERHEEFKAYWDAAQKKGYTKQAGGKKQS